VKNRAGWLHQDSEQRKPQPREAAKVVAGGGEHGVDGVAAGMGEVIAAHAVVFLESNSSLKTAAICMLVAVASF